MKKRTLVELVQGHCENNPYLFNKALDELIEDFAAKGDLAIAEHLRALSSRTITLSPQSAQENKKTLSFLAFQIFFTRFPTPLNPYIYLIP